MKSMMQHQRAAAGAFAWSRSANFLDGVSLASTSFSPSRGLSLVFPGLFRMYIV